MRLDPLLGAVLGVTLWLGMVLTTALVVQRTTTADPEIIRKIVHMGTGNVILLAWWWQVPTWMGVTAAVLAALVTLISYWVPLVPGIDSVQRRSGGTFFYAVSIGVLMAWFWPQGNYQYTVLGILIMVWGDGLAAVVGKRWGKHPYALLGIHKTWEGSLTMAGVSGLVAVGVLGWTPLVLVVAVGAAILEIFSYYGLDNLTVPLGTAGLAFWWQNLWLG
ncbi:phosphatidate cytidylyltransferase [Gloeomargarita lithophora Alchichica-D10]|uniref:Phosphatidate cytidylyltransferase n=1 Tax=Gloeomargarita lithophora Alchichica-D10 TaxID=1188229 RepID=A0A1J0A9V3_9CYAN|nr:diacylglycerol/polyprenol kinase family protein [Gloeomargarita lithophora]APB32703.1 phosphatidate cytidylyltransferase [Gloeomargarita lithophora Alchichica-D10]